MAELLEAGHEAWIRRCTGRVGLHHGYGAAVGVGPYRAYWREHVEGDDVPIYEYLTGERNR